MSKANNKTKKEKTLPSSFIKTLPPKEQMIAKILLKIFREATGARSSMWGNMIGFGSYHYKYDSGREGDYFAMRKSGPTLYIMPSYKDYSNLLKKLGPHKLGKSCLYLKNLDDIDLKVLQKLVKTGIKDLSKIYPVKI